jgi:hypothetical protein
MYSRRLAIDKASLPSLEETQKTFLSHSRVGRLDSLISEEESLSSIFGHHGAALALRRCLTWTAFRPASIHAGGVVLAVSVDEDCGSYDTFLKKHPVRFQTTCEPTSKRVSLDYGTVGIPETYVIDRHGRIVRKVIGPQQWDSAEMLAYFDALLAPS